MSASAYRPGYCNIGRAEQRKRYRYALVGFLTAAAYVAAVLLTSTPPELLLGAFAPLALGCEFLVQARARFCVRFALLGRYDFTGAGGDSGTVDAAADRRADTKYALRITALSVVLAGVVTVAVYLLAGGV